jgi:hypothetical protein
VRLAGLLAAGLELGVGLAQPRGPAVCLELLERRAAVHELRESVQAHAALLGAGGADAVGEGEALLESGCLDLREAWEGLSDQLEPVLGVLEDALGDGDYAGGAPSPRQSVPEPMPPERPDARWAKAGWAALVVLLLAVALKVRLARAPAHLWRAPLLLRFYVTARPVYRWRRAPSSAPTSSSSRARRRPSVTANANCVCA